MSVEVWPPVAPGQLKVEEDATQARELAWFLGSLRTTLRDLKRGLEDCYALLAPIDPGSTLVLTTPRHELVKGHITRVGTRIIKGSFRLQFRTLPAQTLTIRPDRPVHLAPLSRLHTLLTRSVDLLADCSSIVSPSQTDLSTPGTGSIESQAAQLSENLSSLTKSLASASLLLKGAAPLSAPADIGWTQSSTSIAHFRGTPCISSNLSLYFTIQEACLVLYLRTLEPSDTPLNLGARLAFAIGTARRIEHDEAERVFPYSCDEHSRPDAPVLDVPSSPVGGGGGGGGGGGPQTPPAATLNPASAAFAFVTGGGNSHLSSRPSSSASTTDKNNGSNHKNGAGAAENENMDDATAATNPTGVAAKSPEKYSRSQLDVCVREKVRVESADPSLLSLSAKLGALTTSLALARRNLAAVRGMDMEQT